MRTEQNKILSELTPKMIDLNLARIQNDLYQTKLDQTILCLNYFSFQEKFIWPKISWPEVDWKWLESKYEPTHVDPKMTRFELEPNDPFVKSLNKTLAFLWIYLNKWRHETEERGGGRPSHFFRCVMHFDKMLTQVHYITDMYIY